MLNWLAEHSALMQVAVAIVTALVWVIYLQLFLSSLLRQRRPEILISLGPGIGMEARCFIANLGLEPIYIAQLLMRVETDEGHFDAAITERDRLSEDEMRDPTHATNQGPLKSADSFDCGSFGELLERACQRHGCDPEQAQGFELTVVANNAATASFVGASRRFDVVSRDGGRDVLPDGLATTQIRSFLGRRRLRALLRRDLDWYRS